jgi:hypothetical protein
MRIWTLHPRYLDRQGLTAAWREALLAQKVLAGATRGYRGHPQLVRFRGQPDPAAAIAAYLRHLREEALSRGYAFDAARIATAAEAVPILEAEEQLRYEWSHLMGKLRARSPAMAERYAGVVRPDAHPLFRIVPGPVASWERT